MTQWIPVASAVAPLSGEQAFVRSHPGLNRHDRPPSGRHNQPDWNTKAEPAVAPVGQIS